MEGHVMCVRMYGRERLLLPEGHNGRSLTIKYNSVQTDMKKDYFAHTTEALILGRGHEFQEFGKKSFGGRGT